MNSVELYNHQYKYALDEIGIRLYDKTKEEDILLIPYEKIAAINLHCEPPTRFTIHYRYFCKIEYKSEHQQNKKLVISNFDNAQYYTFIENLHKLLAKQPQSIRYKSGLSWLEYIIKVMLIAPIIFFSFVMLKLSFYLGFLFVLLSCLLLGRYLWIDFPVTYSPTNVPIRLLPDMGKKQDIFLKHLFNEVLYADIRYLYLFIVVLCMFALLITLVVSGIMHNTIHKDKIKRSLYNNTKSEIAAIYIDSSANILESDLVLKPNQKTEIWIAVDCEKQKDKNSTVKLKFTDSTFFEMRIPVCSRYNGCHYDICINDDGK
jgi:hypothetical protein